MAGSLNKVTLIGNLGGDPEVRSFQNGGEVANINIATSDSWTDKNSGEKKEKTEWHKVAIFSPGLVNVVKNYLKKGSKVYIEGALETRKWQDKEGNERYTTEIVLKGYDAKLIMLDGRGSGQGGYASNSNNDYGSEPSAPLARKSAPKVDELEDEIPF